MQQKPSEHIPSHGPNPPTGSRETPSDNPKLVEILAATDRCLQKYRETLIALAD